MDVFYVAIIIGLIPASVAKNKGQSFFLWWVYGAALFIVALPHAILMKPTDAALEEEYVANGMKKCPYCAEMIKMEAKICRYCGHDLECDEKATTKDRENLPLSNDLSIKNIVFPRTLKEAFPLAVFFTVLLVMFSNKLPPISKMFSTYSIYNQVAKDAEAQYDIVSNGSNLIDMCVYAGLVKAAYIQAQDEANHKLWERKEKIDCDRARRP